MVDLSKLQADVDAQSTVINSVTALLSGLSAQITALKSAGTSDAATQTAIDALALEVEQNSGTLAASVQANTPVAPVTEPAPTVTVPAATVQPVAAVPPVTPPVVLPATPAA